MRCCRDVLRRGWEGRCEYPTIRCITVVLVVFPTPSSPGPYRHCQQEHVVVVQVAVQFAIAGLGVFPWHYRQRRVAVLVAVLVLRP